MTEQPTEVRLDLLTNEEAGPGGARELEPLQRVGLYLAVSLMTAIAVATIGIAIIAFGTTAAVPPPVPPSQQTAESIAQYRDLVGVYKTLGDPPLDRAKELFQLVVITALLPPFTAVLGYIFGTRKAVG